MGTTPMLQLVSNGTQILFPYAYKVFDKNPHSHVQKNGFYLFGDVLYCAYFAISTAVQSCKTYEKSVHYFGVKERHWKKMGCRHHHLNTTISLCRTARPPSCRSSTTMRELVMVIAMVTRAVPFHVLINIFHLSASSFFLQALLCLDDMTIRLMTLTKQIQCVSCPCGYLFMKWRVDISYAALELAFMKWRVLDG